jgi:hypothetical protein
MGVDIGQKRDPTAICLVEVSYRSIEATCRCHFLVRHLERLPLGTLYPEVAHRVGFIAIKARNLAGNWPHLFVDATGVGQPVVDLLHRHVPSSSVVAIYFTHGNHRREKELSKVSLGKAYLVSRLQSLLQTRRLHLPDTTEARALARELLDYEIRVDENANDRYGAFRVGTHDDLVTALGLAVQSDPTTDRRLGTRGKKATKS